MKNIIELNIEIENIFNPDIIYYHLSGNTTVNQSWVNEIDSSYFNDYEERIKEKIDLIADLDSSGKINFLKLFHQDVLHKYKEQIKLNFSDLEYLKSITKIYIASVDYEEAKQKTSDIDFPRDDMYEAVLEKLAKLFELEDFDMYNGDFLESKNIIDEMLLDISKKEDLEKLAPTVDEFGLENYFGLDGEFDEDYGLSAKESLLGRYYSYAYLSLFLESNKDMLGRIAEYIEYLIVLVKKVENYGEELTFEEVHNNNPNNLKLEFKINKKEIAMLFKNLSDFGYFHVDNTGFKHPHTQLKKYIANANMYFPHNGEIKLIKDIKKEYSKVYGMEERVMHQNMEKEFLKDLIKKLTERIKEIDSEEF
ncbi:hypothetical protein [uncultured Lutibacter sp.]|uniref:hypothetical protein n=1 Tax=uncultured Lutibacter sp. TaxID=437739 RepID=UPI00262DA59B|nr:hypothetical protein [uncultured Lutibacter sp.]